VSALTIVANEPYDCISGGIPRILREITPRLAERFMVRLLVLGSEKDLKIEKLQASLEIYHFPHYNLPVGDTYPPECILKYVKKAIAESDLLFIQSVDCIVPLCYALRIQKPWVMYFHGIDWETFPRAVAWPWLGRQITPLVKAYARFWYNRAETLIIPSPDLDKVLANAKVTASRRVIPLGLDHQNFVPAVNQNQAKEKLGFSPLDIVLGYIGRLAREKNVGFLLNLFDTLHTKYPSIKLLLVGSGVKDFETRINSNPAIRAVGQTNDVIPYLHAMDLFCMPSEIETSSLSSMEAMSCGIPVVASAVGSLREYLFHRHNGFLAIPGDEADYQHHVEELIEDRHLRHSMGALARETMLARPSWDQTVEAMGDLFEELI